MLSSGNSNTAVCVNNLLKISRGEVPYERLKGVNFSGIDGPATTASEELTADLEWMLGVYEPRAVVDNISITPTDAQNGQFTISAEISAREAKT